jgi:hypothetical protein
MSAKFVGFKHNMDSNANETNSESATKLIVSDAVFIWIDIADLPRLKLVRNLVLG